MTIKKLATKIFAVAACAAMVATSTPVSNVQSVQAATTSQGTVNLNTNKLVITNGSKTAITNGTLTMVKGRRYQVKAKFGSTTVTTKGTYKSNKPAVVTVSATGLITAKAPGTCTIKVTYGGKTQSFKVKVVASHTHSWKTITKATCAAKGKKLCKTCGVTGSTAMKTTHTFTTTKKATCATKGTQTCSVCGIKESIAKTAHKWQTDTWKGVEGRGKAYTVSTVYCNGCNVDMTDWTHEERIAHKSDLNNLDCFSCGVHGASGVERYPKYMMTEIVETYCKNCGTQKDKTKTDLYECDIEGNKIVKDNPAPTPSPVDPGEVIPAPETPDVSLPETPVSGNETVSDNNIADPGNGGGDISSGSCTENDGDAHTHDLLTELREEIEGRGELYTPVTITCNKCGVDMSDWSAEEIDSHIYSVRSGCFGASLTRTEGEPEYPEYVMVRTETSTCATCGEVKETKTDLYECDANGDLITDEPDDGEDYDGSEGEVTEDE